MNGQGIFKSAIQLAIEKKNTLDAFTKACIKLTEDYTVENSVFSFNGKNLDEVTNGFMVGIKSSNDINELRTSLNNCANPIVRIQENENGISFEVGEYYDAASKIENADNIYNISRRTYILEK